MDVVPHAGAVWRGIVLAEDADMLLPSQRRFHHQRDQVGFRLVILADACLRVGTGGIEVAQRRIADAIGSVTPFQHILDGQLCSAVGVGRLGAVALLDGLLLRLAVGGRRGGEHDLIHAMRLHR